MKVIKLNLGSGVDYREGYVNIDSNPNVKNDICDDFINVRDVVDDGTVDEVLTIHSIGYLRLWQAKALFVDVFAILKPGGQFILEFPDIFKLASTISTRYHDTARNIDHNTERDAAIRAIYGFDANLQDSPGLTYNTYKYGWSDCSMAAELKVVGFQVTVESPTTHGERIWRDSRIRAVKP
jgi:predicted SAM-dependent methyltransferase